MELKFEDQIEKYKNECKTAEDWKHAFDWAIEQAKDAMIISNRLMDGVLNLYGNDELRRVLEVTFNNDEIFRETDALRQQMHEYGYTNDIMYPVPVEIALELYNRGVDVWELHSDNTERLLATEKDIKESECLLGINYDYIIDFVSDIADNIDMLEMSDD